MIDPIRVAALIPSPPSSTNVYVKSSAPERLAHLRVAGKQADTDDVPL